MRTGHLGLWLGQKLSKLSLKDHCSRDPVQVQSGQTCMLGMARDREGEAAHLDTRCMLLHRRFPCGTHVGGSCPVCFWWRRWRQHNALAQAWAIAWHIESYPAEFVKLGQESRKNSEIHIDVSHSRQPLVKGERLVRYEVNTVMTRGVAQVQGRSTTPAMCTHSKYDCTGLHTKQHLKMHMCRLILAMVRYAWRSLSPTVLGSYVIGSPRGCAAPGEVPCQGNT